MYMHPFIVLEITQRLLTLQTQHMDVCGCTAQSLHSVWMCADIVYPICTHSDVYGWNASYLYSVWICADEVHLICTRSGGIHMECTSQEGCRWCVP